jgi:hypothetical protein
VALACIVALMVCSQSAAVTHRFGCSASFSICICRGGHKVTEETLQQPAPG